jgi:predicted 5'-methylthioadenosine/S-adenosylhomocysteine nucleosidase
VILVVAATAFEAALVDGLPARAIVSGVGPVEAALAAARAIAEERPRAIVQIGIAGAKTLPHASLALGSEAVYCDVIDPAARIPRIERVEPDAPLLAAARRALPDAHVLPIATAGRVGGGAACEVEAMEGFGVLRAAELAGVPAVELRAISNPVAEADRNHWRVDDALDALRIAVPRLLEELTRA